jgi:hypothetical protein
MIRDMDVLRELLFSIERRGSNGKLQKLLDGTSSDERLSHHLQLLVEGGFAKAVSKTQQGGIRLQLTWEGHELAALSRSDELWQRAKDFVQEKTGGLSLTALKATLAKWSVDIISAGERWKLKSESGPTHRIDPVPAEPPAARIPEVALPTEPRFTFTQPYQAVSFVAGGLRPDSLFFSGEAEGLPIYLL